MSYYDAATGSCKVADFLPNFKITAPGLGLKDCDEIRKMVSTFTKYPGTCNINFQKREIDCSAPSLKYRLKAKVDEKKYKATASLYYQNQVTNLNVYGDPKNYSLIANVNQNTKNDVFAKDNMNFFVTGFPFESLKVAPDAAAVQKLMKTAPARK